MSYQSIDLAELRRTYSDYKNEVAFPHQTESYNALTKIFNFPATQYKGGLLVLPTGAGKTFTAVNWLYNNVVPQNIKILWLAQSSNLLDQAYKEFYQNALTVPHSRNTLNIRVVSSSLSHSNVASIEDSDDILIITTQSAIISYNSEPLNLRGEKLQTKFREFIESNKNNGLFVVLDEAHHAPAYGCRKLLEGIQKTIPNYYLLGLTATPTYTDKKRSGFLYKIFDQEVIYEAKKTKLIAQDILAKPIYIEKQTGREYKVDDSLYERLVRQHKDLPEDIIEKLSRDSARNDYIVHEYFENKDAYRKTIIFADRWYQCKYLETKLREKGVRVESVFSKIDADPGSPEERNKRTASDNERIIREFKEGRFDVLINVRMLAEGADVPDVKTVFLTRQTTSSILFNQMMGRALRGKKAGGGENKADANIVLFMDDWKRLIYWSKPDGGTEDSQPVRGYYPLELISIRLIEELSRQIESGIVINPRPYLEFIPVGWYQAQLTMNTSDGTHDELQNFTEFIMVYDFNKDKFDKAIDYIKNNYHEEWSDEKLDDTTILPQISEIISKFFDPEQDDIGETLKSDLIKIARHIASKDEKPEYYSFDVRSEYDLDEVAKNLVDKNPRLIHEELKIMFNKSGSLWKVFYGDYFRFKTAVDAAINGILLKGSLPPPQPLPSTPGIEPPFALKRQVILRDGERCLCCSRKKGKGIRLEVDHIIPVFMGGRTILDNLQTLCSICNKNKGINAINFRDIHSSPLQTPNELKFPLKSSSEDVGNSLQRIINFFYHCQAVANLYYHIRSSGKYYTTWEIELFTGNNADWLQEQKGELLEYIHNDLDFSHVEDLIITEV